MTPEADARWGAELFQRKGGFIPYSKFFAARVHVADPAIIDRLVSAFGGRSSKVIGTYQWRLSGVPLESFLRTILPFVTSTDVVDVCREALEKIEGRKEVRRAKAAVALTTSVLDDAELFGRIPEGPWTDSPLFDIPSTIVLEAETPEIAAGFAADAEKRGRTVLLSGRRVRLEQQS